MNTRKATWKDAALFIEKYERRICDSCDNLYESPDGTIEVCMKAKFSGPLCSFTQAYADERLSGDKKTCKEWRKIVDMTKM
jgi:hypothetical protein